jgi:spore germination protein YaaH
VYRNGRRVAQTRATTVRVRAKIGRRYSFAVAVMRAGRPRCRVVRTIVNYVPPGKPRELAVALARGRAAITWSRGRPGDGKLAGYRVYRDRKTVRQLKRTRITLSLSARGTHRIAVRAVDTRGHRSRAAKTTVSTTASPPSPPQGLQGVALSDTAIRLSWQPARQGSNPLAGYRVFRDGRALGQGPGTERMVGNLRVRQAYTFTVAAVDRQGIMSAPSRALTVTTNPPAPTRGTMHAFLLASTGRSFEDFRAHYAQIGAVHPTYFACNRATAAIEGRDDPQITQFALLRQVEVYARFDCQSADTLHRILTEPGLRQAWLDGMTSATVQYGYTGINLDWEAGRPADRNANSAFAADLAARLHAVGKKLTVDVAPKFEDVPSHPRSGIYDYRAIAASADNVFVMAWGIHWATSPPGPIADMPWVQKVVSYVNTLPRRERYIIGAPLYAMDWPAGGGLSHPATAYEWSAAVALAARFGQTPAYDAVAHEMHFAYTDNGVAHQVWGLNAAAVVERMRLYRTNGYQIGVWRLGEEDQALWSDPIVSGAAAAAASER